MRTRGAHTQNKGSPENTALSGSELGEEVAANGFSETDAEKEGDDVRDAKAGKEEEVAATGVSETQGAETVNCPALVPM